MTLVLGTRNVHKTHEICACLGEGYQFRTLLDFPDAPRVSEDQPTFAGNAAKKAAALAAWLLGRAGDGKSGGMLVLADDSGLEVDALGGAPGVHSARFAALDRGGDGNSTDADNNAKLLGLLSGLPPELRTARFRCVVAVAEVSFGIACRATRDASEPGPCLPAPRLFEGTCEGRILDEPRGCSGFGYDPLFLPDGHTQTFAELGEEIKNRISHRARALASLRLWLENRGKE